MCEGGGRQLIRTSDDDMIELTTSDASYSLSLDGCRLPLAKAFNSPWFAFAVLVVTAGPGVVKRGPADSHGLLRQWGGGHTLTGSRGSSGVYSRNLDLGNALGGFVIITFWSLYDKVSEVVES